MNDRQDFNGGAGNAVRHDVIRMCDELACAAYAAFSVEVGMGWEARNDAIEICVKIESGLRILLGNMAEDCGQVGLCLSCDVSIGYCGSFGLDLRNWKSPNPQFARKPTE